MLNAKSDNSPRATGVRAVLALGAALLLSACSGQWSVSYDDPVARADSTSWRISSVQVNVPESLSVSEQNSFTPNADIVWHGDLPGDRRAQVRSIMTESGRRAVSPLRGSRRATLNLTVSEFHGVTPTAVARAPAAVHNISFMAQVVDGGGNALTAPTLIRADLPAYVGDQAYAAAANGQGQKVRVTQHIDAVLKGWLGIGPDIRGTFSSVGR